MATTTTTSSASTARAAAAPTDFTGVFITPVPLIVVPTAAEVTAMMRLFRPSHAIEVGSGLLSDLAMLKLLLPASSARLAIPADNIAAGIIGRISTNAAKVATTRAITEREGRAE